MVKGFGAEGAGKEQTMRINILQKGDKVLTVTKEFIAVQRKNGEVDIVMLVRDETGLRIDTENIVTIGYGHYSVEVTDGDVTVINV